MTLQPDAGMSALAADLARRNQGAAEAAAGLPPAPAGGGAGLELEVFGRLAVALDANTAAMRRLERPRIPWEACHPVTLAPAQTSAAGSIDDPDRWGPKEGWAWQVTELAVTLGANASQWSIYQDAAQPTNLKMQNTVSGAWEPKGWILLPNQRIVYASAGGGITVSIGAAIEIALDWLSTYLM